MKVFHEFGENGEMGRREHYEGGQVCSLCSSRQLIRSKYISGPPGPGSGPGPTVPTVPTPTSKSQASHPSDLGQQGETIPPGFLCPFSLLRSGSPLPLPTPTPVTPLQEKKRKQPRDFPTLGPSSGGSFCGLGWRGISPPAPEAPQFSNSSPRPLHSQPQPGPASPPGNIPKKGRKEISA